MEGSAPFSLCLLITNFPVSPYCLASMSADVYFNLSYKQPSCMGLEFILMASIKVNDWGMDTCPACGSGFKTSMPYSFLSTPVVIQEPE